MTKETLAAQLNGREYLQEITPTEALEAKASKLLVIFGASDDLIELRGASDDEAGAWDGRELLIRRDGEMLPDLEREDITILEKHSALARVQELRAQAVKITAKWDEGGYSWLLETTFQHAAFDIMEGAEKYCRGLVIDLKEIASQ